MQMKAVKNILSQLFVQAPAIASPTAALAAVANNPDLVPANIVGIDNVVTVVQAAIRLLLIVAFVAAFVLLIIGGIRWILAGGDEKAVAGARGTITAALIGLVIVLVAYAIIRLVEIFFNVSIITGGVTIPNINT